MSPEPSVPLPALSVPELQQRECEHAEAELLLARIDSGRHLLDLLRFEPPETVVDAVVGYALDCEELARTYRRVFRELLGVSSVQVADLVAKLERREAVEA